MMIDCISGYLWARIVLSILQLFIVLYCEFDQFFQCFS